jgi:hypothetical protein
MRADAEFAATTMPAASVWRAAPVLLLGLAHLMAGDPDQADALFEDAAAEGQASGGMIGACIALVQRSLLAIGSGAWDLAGRHLSEARAVANEANLEDYPPLTILYAVAARIALHQANRPRAQEELTRAQRLRPALTYALPHLAVQARIELAKCHLALADFTATRTLLREVDDVLRRRPASVSSPARPKTSGRSSPMPRLVRPGSLGADRRRAAPAADSRYPPVVPRDRRRDVPVPQHHQVGGERDLPQAGRLFAQPGDRPLPRAGASGGVTTRFIPSGGWKLPWHEVQWCPRQRGEVHGPDSEIPGHVAQASDDR